MDLKAYVNPTQNTGLDQYHEIIEIIDNWSNLVRIWLLNYSASGRRLTPVVDLGKVLGANQRIHMDSHV